MPLYDIEDEKGRKFTLDGDSEPTEQELEEIFASADEPLKADAPSIPTPQAIDDLDPLRRIANQAEAGRVFQPSQFSSGVRMIAPGELNPDLDFPRELAKAPQAAMGYVGNVARGAVADVAAGMRADPEFSGNLPAAIMGNELPIDRALADISKEAPGAATLGKISQGIAGSLPLMAVMPQGALGKLVAAGFTADMLHSGGEAATMLGEEMGKNPQDRDADKITTALSTLAQSAAFAPLTAAHAGGKAIGERVAPKAEVIRELSRELSKEPLSPDRGGVRPVRELGLQLDDGGNVLARPDIAQLADRALQEGPNPPLERGEVSALEQIRRELNPPEITLTEPTRVAERIEGGGEAPFGKVSFQRGAEAPTAPRTQAARAVEPIFERSSQSEVARTSEAEAVKPTEIKYPERPSGETEAGFRERLSGRQWWEVSKADAERARAYDYLAGGEKRKNNFGTVKEMEDFHRQQVADAVAAGKSVPKEVLKDYPELGQKSEGSLRVGESKSEILDADAVAKMSPEEFVSALAENKRGATDAGYELSLKITPEQRTGLNAKAAEMDAQSKATMQELQSSATPEAQAAAFKKMQDINAKKQYFNEAGRMYDAIKAIDEGMPIAEANKKFGVIERELKQYSERAKQGQALKVKTTEIAEPISLKDTAAEVSKFEAEFPGAPKINIAPDFSAMPKSAQDLALRVGSDPRLIEAYVRNGEVWINGDAVTSPAMVRRLALHETGGHWAVDNKLGGRLQRFMEQTHDSWANSETMAGIRARYPNAGKVTLGRELVAHLAENPTLAPKVWNRILAQFRQWLRDAGWVKKVTENDIQALITGAIDGMRKAERGEATSEGMLSLKSAADAAKERYPDENGPKKAALPKPIVGESPAGAGVESVAPRIEGGPERMRQSAARATTSEQVPPPVQERIAEAPESFYKSQKYKSVEEAVAAAGDAELAAVPKESNFHVASQLELSRRLFEQGKLEEGYEVFKNVSRQGTEWGQNINQFKMLKGTTPANIIDLVNMGLKEAGRDPLTKPQMEGLARTADESIQANRNLETAKQEWQKNPTDANAKKAQDLLDAANKADLETQRQMNRFKIKPWPQMLKTFAQGNPLTPISHVSNFIGNTLGAAMEGSSRSVGTLMDAIRASLGDGQRRLSVSPKNAVEAMKGFGEGLSKAPGVLSKGSGDVVKGESRLGLQPLRALAKAFAKNPDVPTVGGKVPVNERIRLAVEGTFGIAPETMLRLLSAADKPAYEAARARLISEQAKLKGVAEKDLPMARKFPELFFDKETLKLIKEESADAIFQRPSKVVSNLQNIIREKGGDWADLAFTILVSTYKLTPWNLVVRTLQYNPLIAAAKTGIEAAKGNTRAAEISAGRMVVGSILYGAGYYLYQNGLIGPSLEGRGESQKERLLAGEVLPPNHVNISGLKRAIEGGDPKFQPGDETIDLTRGGGAAGAILSSVANIGRAAENKPEQGGSELAASLVANGVLEQANFTINQSFLKGITGLLDAIQNRNFKPYIQGLENMILNVGTPNTLTALSRATRETAPDMKADSFAQEAGDVIRNRFGILGADDYLPAKRDLFGEPMPQTPEGRNAILYHLFDISKGKQVADDPVKLEIYNLWRKTANSEVIPSIPTREITVKKETYPIPRALYSRFAELVGKARKERADELVQNPLYLKATDEEKITAFERAYRKGMDVAKEQFWKEHGAELEKKPMKAGFK